MRPPKEFGVSCLFPKPGTPDFEDNLIGFRREYKKLLDKEAEASRKIHKKEEKSAETRETDEVKQGNNKDFPNIASRE